MKERMKNEWMDGWIWCSSSDDGVAMLVSQERHVLDGFSFEAGDFVLLIFVLCEPLLLEIEESCGKFASSSS